MSGCCGENEIAVQDEGIPLGDADTLNFEGAGVGVVVAGKTATITIPGSGGVEAQNEGVAVAGGPFSTINVTDEDPDGRGDAKATDQGGAVMGFNIPDRFLSGWDYGERTVAGVSVTTAMGALAMPTVSVSGVGTARAADGSAIYGRGRISILQTAPNGVAGWFTQTSSGATVIRGNAVGGPGFVYVQSFGVCDVSDSYQATARGFHGLTASGAVPTDVSPATLANLIGIGYESGDVNLRLFIRAGAVAGIDLGAGFPIGVAGTPELYRFTAISPPGNDTDITWRLDRVRTGTSVGGVVAAPGITNTPLFERCIRSSGTAGVTTTAVVTWGARMRRSGFQP